MMTSQELIHGVHLLVSLPQLYSLAPSKTMRPYEIRAELYTIVTGVWEKATELQVRAQFLLLPPLFLGKNVNNLQAQS